MTGRNDRRGGRDAHETYGEVSSGHVPPHLDDRYYDDPQYAALAYDEARDYRQGEAEYDEAAYGYEDRQEASQDSEWTYDERRQVWVDRDGRPYVESEEDAEERYAPYADDEYLASDEEYLAPQEDARLPQRRSRSGVLSLAALVLVASMGGGLAYAWKKGAFVGSDIPGLGGPPPVIRASTDPVKIKPAETMTAAVDQPNPEIFNRKEDTASPAKEKLVPHDEQPVAVVPVKNDPVSVRTASVDAGSAPSSAALPAPANDDTASASSTRSVATSNITLPAPPGGVAPAVPDGSPPDGPRKVKTIKIMGDNTVVTGEAPISGSNEPASTSRPIDISGITPTAPLAQADQQANDPAAPNPPANSEPTASAPAPEQAPSTAATDKPAASDAVPADDSADNDAAATTVVEPTRSAEVATPPVRPAIPPVRPRNIPTAPAAAKPTQVASAEPVASPIAGTGFVVQVSSQKTPADAQAAFQSLQRRYASVIGNLKGSVRKVELGDRGTYYRVRVGLWASSSEAAAFCSRLKAAGGDCVVARN